MAKPKPAVSILAAIGIGCPDPLQERWLRHIEELQLVSIGVAADRISDIATNVLKLFLIEYTQRQASLWNIPLGTAVPVNHYFDFDDYAWRAKQDKIKNSGL